jgi:hypothetical protein
MCIDSDGLFFFNSGADMGESSWVATPDHPGRACQSLNWPGGNIRLGKAASRRWEWDFVSSGGGHHLRQKLRFFRLRAARFERAAAEDQERA